MNDKSHEAKMYFLAAAATCCQDLDVRVETESKHLPLIPDHQMLWFREVGREIHWNFSENSSVLVCEFVSKPGGTW